MKPILARNIDRTGRLMRGVIALALIITAGFAFTHALWLGIVITALAVFSLFEALRGWCMLRACGIKTRF
jgi:hypothetical protein